MRLDKFNQLPDAVKKILLEAGRKTQLMQEQKIESATEKGYTALDAHGVKVYTPTRSELIQWTKIAPDVWAQFKNEAPPQVIQRLLKEQQCPSTGCVPLIRQR